MTLIVPLVATGNQKLTVNLGNQQCSIKLSQKEDYIYMDLTIGTKAITVGAICRDRVSIVRHGYQGFVGNLVFVDTQGFDDPNQSALGSRWKLAYLP